MKNDDIKRSSIPQIMAYSTSSMFCPMITNESNRYLIINKKNIPLSSLRVENLIIVLYDLDKKNKSAEIMTDRAIM